MLVGPLGIGGGDMRLVVLSMELSPSIPWLIMLKLYV